MDRAIEMSKNPDVDLDSLMDVAPDNSPAMSNGASENGATDSDVKRKRSLSSGGSFVSLVNEDGERLEKEIWANRLMREELVIMNDRLNGVMNQQNVFQKEASTLVGQVSESLATLDNSRVRREKLAEAQRNQMNDLMVQTQQIITQCQQTNVEMKVNQQTLNAQFTEFEKWRRDVETEIITNKGSQQVFSEKW